MQSKRTAKTFGRNDFDLLPIDIRDDHALGLGFCVTMTYTYLPYNFARVFVIYPENVDAF
jgi:hypothetical protein